MTYYRPFNYVFEGRVTNRKHRVVDATIGIFSDHDFVLNGLCVLHPHGAQISITIPDLTSKPLSPELTKDPSFPLPVFPEMVYKAGKRIKITVQLVGDVGRKRPRFQIVCLGKAREEVDEKEN